MALAVAVNIVWTGYKLIQRSVAGLMDATLPKDELAQVNQVLAAYQARGVQFHALRTRSAGARRFVSVHVLVPGNWTVHKGHQLLEELEASIRELFPDVNVLTHLESLEDPASWDDKQDR